MENIYQYINQLETNEKYYIDSIEEKESKINRLLQELEQKQQKINELETKLYKQKPQTKERNQKYRDLRINKIVEDITSDEYQTPSPKKIPTLYGFPLYFSNNSDIWSPTSNSLWIL